MNIFIRKVKNAVGRDGLDEGVCEFEKVIKDDIRLESIAEESDYGVVYTFNRKKITLNSIFRRIPGYTRNRSRNYGDSDTNTISYKYSETRSSKDKLYRKWWKALKKCFTSKHGQYDLY